MGWDELGKEWRRRNERILLSNLLWISLGFYAITNRFASGDNFTINQLLPNIPIHFREGREGINHRSLSVIWLLLLSWLLTSSVLQKRAFCLEVSTISTIPWFPATHYSRCQLTNTLPNEKKMACRSLNWSSGEDIKHGCIHQQTPHIFIQV